MPSDRETFTLGLMRTSLCDLLGIEYPILSVGFGEGARADLVSAVSNAGGFGVLGASGDEPDFIRSEAERTRTLTDRPFGFNLIIVAEDDWAKEKGYHEGFPAYVRAMIAAAGGSATAAVFFWGDPAPYVKPAHDAGMKVLIQVGSVEEAEAAAGAGVDAVIAQGVEAGGHVGGTKSIWELLPAAVARVAPLPVLASGGIGDGAGLARALSLRAAGVSLGTRFVASDEANVHIDFKRRIVAATSADTVYTPDLYDVGGRGRLAARSATRPTRNGRQWGGLPRAHVRARASRSGGTTSLRGASSSGRATP